MPLKRAPTAASVRTALKYIDSDWELLFANRGRDALVDVLRSYWASLGITTALIGSLAFSSALSSLEPTEFLALDGSADLHWDANVSFHLACAYYAFMYASTLFAILSLIILSAFYNHFLAIVAVDDTILWFVNKWPVGLPDVLFTLSLVTFLLGACMSLLLTLPRVFGLVVLSVFVVIFMPFVIWFLNFQIVTQKKSNTVLGSNAKKPWHPLHHLVLCVPSPALTMACAYSSFVFVCVSVAYSFIVQRRA